MKNALICSGFLLLCSILHAQAPMTGTPPSPTSVNAQANAAWYRGGNNGPPNGLSGNNIFGTHWNSPIYTITNGERRMKLNGDLGTMQYSINDYVPTDGVNTSGFLLLGNNTTVVPFSNDSIYNIMGAFSLLHLNGSMTGEQAYRPWMRTGVTFTDAGDLGYLGLRFGNDLGGPNNISEMVIAWGNDAPGSAQGPDDMVLRFLGRPTSDHATVPSTDLNTHRDFDGRQIARFAAIGNVRIGPSYSHVAGQGPTHRLDVEGNARLRSVPASNAPDCIMLGNALSGGALDVEFQRLALPNDNTKFLDGTGAWQTIPSGGGSSINGAHNGASISGYDNTKIALGQSYNQSGTNPAALIDSRYVPMNDHNVYFTNNPTNPLSNTGYNKVGIGTGDQSLAGKLTVQSINSGEATTLALLNSNTTGSLGTFIQVNGVTPTTGLNNYGERIYVSGSQSSNQGTEYVVTGGNEAIGITIDATGGTNGLGIRSTASGTGTVTGLLGIANGGSANYGVRGIAPSTPNSYAGYFDGNVYVNGSGTYTTSWSLSDQRYKREIQPLEGINAKLEKLHGYTYRMRTEEFKEKNFSENEQIGLIAQEVKEVFPQLVREDEKGYLAVNYDGMVPVLLEALKEQKQEIDALKSLVEEMVNDAGASANAVQLSNVETAILDQNAPNPFAERTVIHFSLPAEVQRAQMLFYDQSGHLIQTVDIKERGNSKLLVFGATLSAGTYSYSLVADGKVIESKLMVKQ